MCRRRRFREARGGEPGHVVTECHTCAGERNPGALQWPRDMTMVPCVRQDLRHAMRMMPLRLRPVTLAPKRTWGPSVAAA